MPLARGFGDRPRRASSKIETMCPHVGHRSADVESGLRQSGQWVSAMAKGREARRGGPACQTTAVAYKTNYLEGRFGTRPALSCGTAWNTQPGERMLNTTLQDRTAHLKDNLGWRGALTMLPRRWLSG